MQYGTYVLGMLAAAVTSYLPQLQKTMPQNSTFDLSLKMPVVPVSRRRPLDCPWRSERRFGDHSRQFDRRNLSLAVPGFKIRDLNS
jgi:hypothetical protein